MSGERKPLILVVDDEPEIVMLLEGFLRQEGFDVIAATNGREAVAKGVTHPIDLAVLDIVMPEMDGLDALRALRESRPDLPAVFITAYRYADRVAQACRMGGVECVFKPFDLDAVRVAILSRLKPEPPSGDGA